MNEVLLVIRHPAILAAAGEQFVEHAGGIFERDAVMPLWVRLCLLVVPFEVVGDEACRSAAVG
ncbi:MAG TPA: hypothetical protein PK264_07080 [Hyphomicrobiaceae bacterium]|nr:hypothetical protein [Hyphomicrobiaceae bacterium]